MPKKTVAAKTTRKPSARSAPKSAYEKAGVDIQKADKFVGAIAELTKTLPTLNVKKIYSGYASLYSIGNKQFIAASTDGVGTKLKLAFELGRHNTVGIDLVAMSANDLVCVGARPLFFLDYFATGKLDLKTSKAVISGIVAGCRQAGLALVGGETAEMPGFYKKGEYDLAGFAVGLVREKEIIDGKKLKSGDVILGLESSGPHSNGFSLIRKLVQVQSKKERGFVNACFRPTKIYTSSIAKLGQAVEIKGAAHITGGGFLNIPRIHPGFDYHLDLVTSSFKTPKVFVELKKRARISNQELYTTFNMGIGMVVVVSPSHVKGAIAALKKAGEKAHVLGRLEKKAKKESQVIVNLPDQKLALS